MYKRRLQLNIPIVLYEGAKLPLYAHPGDSGFDLISHNFEQVSTANLINNKNSVIISPHSTVTIGTGIEMAIPYGYELQVRSRSGNSAKKRYVVSNSPGTIDSIYRGEIGVIVHNNSALPITITLGDKIAQGVLCEVPVANFEIVKTLNKTVRGSDGYGSTDKK